MAFDEAEREVEDQADQADGGHADHDDVELHEVAGIDQQVAEAFAGGEQFDKNEGQPGLHATLTDAAEDGRQRGGQGDAPERLGKAELVDLADFAQLDRDVFDTLVGGDGEGNDDGDGNGGNLECFVDAEEDDHQWRPCDDRELREKREARVEVGLGCF